MYNPASHQWSIYGLDLDKGELDRPLIGEFTGKRGEFFDSELRNGRMVQVRYVWTDVSPKSTHMEQSFSPDGGKNCPLNPCLIPGGHSNTNKLSALSAPSP
jgi:hypothetical protein